MSEENLENPSHRISDLIFGVLFIALGAFRIYQLYSGVPMHKFRIFIGAGFFVWGIFKIYAYIKTRP